MTTSTWTPRWSPPRRPRFDQIARMNSVQTISPGARFLFVAACFVVVAAGMRAASSILVPFLLALFVALISAPPLLWLQDKGIPKGLALLMVVLGMVGLGSVLTAVISSSVNDFTAALPTYQENMHAQVAAMEKGLAKLGIIVPEKFLSKTLDTRAVMRLTSQVLLGLSAMITNVFFILLMAIFILMEASDFPVKIKRIMGAPDESMGRVSDFIYDVKRYIFLKTVVSLGTGVFVAVWLWACGVDQYVLWGLLAFLLNYVPNIGSILAAVPAVLLAFIQGGLDLLLLAVLGYVIVNVVVGNIIEPRVMGKGLGLSSLVVLLSLVFWGFILGPVGMLLSIPLTMMVKIGLEGNPSTQWVSVLLGSDDQAVTAAEDD